MEMIGSEEMNQKRSFVLVSAFIMIALGAVLFWPRNVVNGSTTVTGSGTYTIGQCIQPKRGMKPKIRYSGVIGSEVRTIVLYRWIDYDPTPHNWFYPWTSIDDIIFYEEGYKFTITDLTYRSGEWYLSVSWEKQ